MNKDETIQSLVRRLETNFITGYTHPSKYVTTYFNEEMNTIYAYLESQFTQGGKSTVQSGTVSSETSNNVDSQGRDKPFFNIVIAARNIWYRATKIYQKNIKVKSTKSGDTLASFIATAFIQEWMRKINFAEFLNNWGLNSAGFNETVLKFVEQDGELIPSVTPWNRIICDNINFKQNPKIELLELTEADLRLKTQYDQTKVDALISSAKPRETLEKQRKDNKMGYIKLYEVHGVFSQKVYKQALDQEVTDEDEKVFFQQMHVIAYVPLDMTGSYADYTLYCGREKDPYMLTALLPEIDGSIALRGSVKLLFNAQWMVNHSIKAIKDQLDLASKLIFQTSDGNFVGQNALSAIESGDILIHAPNAPLTTIPNTSHDVNSLTAFQTLWKNLANELAGISEAMMGKNPGAGVGWDQTKQQLAETYDLFDDMTANKGRAVEEMLRQFVIPFLKKKLNHSKEIVALLDGYGIQKIDTMYVKSEAIKRMVQKDITSIMNGQVPQQDLKGATGEVQQQISIQGSQRYFKPSDVSDKTWKDIFKDLEWELECEIAGEDKPDKESLATLTTTLSTIAANPRVLWDPNAKMIFNKILSMAGGISALEMHEAELYIPLPQKRFSERIDYKDAPDDIKRQMEEQQGFVPSKMGGSPPEVRVTYAVSGKGLPPTQGQDNQGNANPAAPPGGGSSNLPAINQPTQ